jgi:hypothetical protein
LSKRKLKNSKKVHVDNIEQIDISLLAGQEKRFEIFVMVALFIFGVYQSILYFGHTAVPVSDFPDLFRVGRDILSFQMPRRFKQAPMLGMLQVCVSYFVGGPEYPNLTAGWLLNAILHPFNLVLLWLVGKKIVGKSALWIAVIAILNPWVLYMLTEPLIETTLLFFTLLTFHFIFKRSNFCYLFAAITTMVRYEGVALIGAAFIMDMIYAENKRERIRAFVYSALAAIPLIAWMLATVLTWKEGSTHYLNVFFTKEYSKGFAQSAEGRTGIVLHMKLLWEVGFRPLLMPWLKSAQTSAEMFWKLSKLFAVVGFFFGSIYGLCKRQWKILALLIFFVPYFVLHAKYPYPIHRFHTNIFWIALLLCWFGFQSCWKLIDKNKRTPKPLILSLQALTASVSIVWLLGLVKFLQKTTPISPTSASVPYVAIVFIALIFAARLYIYRSKVFLREFSILALMCLIIVSNQFSLVRQLGDGQKEKEFKLLANWYTTNAKPGEKLAIYMTGIVKMFAPQHAKSIVSIPGAENPSDLIKACYEKDITYVVWASREGLNPHHTGYRQLNLHKNIAFLNKPKDVGPYQFVTTVKAKRGYVNIFRLRKMN